MSDEHFHVHGAHDHAVEHAIERAAHGDGHGEGHHFVSRIAVTTAILSTLGAIGGYEAGHTQNDALLYKNEAAILKTAASDQWNSYQAKAVEQNLAALLMPLTPGEDRERLRQDIERFKLQKSDIKAAAEKLETAARDAEGRSELQLHVHRRWALATTLLQVAIALSAIALLTRKKWLLYGIYGAAAVGVGYGVLGMLYI